jgi:hypothetical protein
VTNKILEYDTCLAKLKDHKSQWASKKKLIEDKITLDKDITDILKWIKKDRDPEKPLWEIENKVTLEERYWNCTQWILSRPEFQDWSKGWYPLENQRASKCVIWINRLYRTGKTTILYVAPFLHLRLSDLGIDTVWFLSCRAYQSIIYKMKVCIMQPQVTKDILEDRCE